MYKLALVILVVVAGACNPTKKQVPEQPDLPRSAEAVAAIPPMGVLPDYPLNIILLIGDGMGITQITAGMYSNGNTLELERFPIVGIHKPYSSDDLVTDSAAGATAFSTGYKTYNGAIGVGPDGKRLRTILEEAESRGLATGMVTTSTIVHATPAAFIAHVAQREMYEAIALDFMKTDIDCFIGGGKKYFDRRDDDRNLLTELEAKGYQVRTYFDTPFDALQVDSTKPFAYLTADKDPLTVEQGRDYLPGATQLAANYLQTRSSGKGFFLMVEGAQIDWGGHANNADYIVREMLDFDKAVGAALDFAEADGHTLVIVTADHEAGGFAINPGSTADKLVAKFTTPGHTGTLIPVFAYGPGAELFAGIYENTAIFHKMRHAYQFDKENR